jgi:hypothetical protein
MTEEHTGPTRPWPCRYCKAGPNEPCRRASGWMLTQPHRVRSNNPTQRWRDLTPTPVDAESERATKVLPKYVWEKVEFTSHCWTWLGAANNKGYGSVWHGGRSLSTHKLSYELLVGPVPDGLQLDHLCLNKLCLKPAHLEPVTPKQNVNRHHIAKFGCASGPNTDDPTYVPCGTFEPVWSAARSVPIL